jgi:uncharacterized ion transporter superfamily protein YfcC
LKKLSFPHPLIIMLAFIVLAMVLTWLVPAGRYARTVDPATGREVVVPGSYERIDSSPVGFFEMLVKVPEGIIAGADVVVLILIFGGAFYIVDKTGAFHAGLGYLVTRFIHTKKFVLVAIGLGFAALGAAINLQEEIIAMVPVLMLMAVKLGYRKVTAVGISFGCAAIGAAFSPMNPFQAQLAQKLAQVELLSGSAYRLVFMGIALIIWFWWMLRFGKAETNEETGGNEDTPAMTNRLVVILLLVAVFLGIMVFGLVKLDWDFNQMSGLIFLLGLLAGIIGNLGVNGTARAYAEGFKEMAFAAVIVGFARSIYLVLQEGLIIDTIVHGLFTPLQNLPTALSAVGMMLAQVALHIPVPSVSGQAALTMPLLTPLSDLIGLSRQVMILAYQYGAGITDMLTPTNGALMAILAACGISYKDWWKFAVKPVLLLYLLGAMAMVLGIMTGI